MTAPIPDDIKVIAQFLARREGQPERWPDFAGAAFRLRRELKSRGGYSARKVR